MGISLRSNLIPTPATSNAVQRRGELGRYADNASMIHGTNVLLRPAGQDDRRDIYEWLVASDVTPLMMGPPTYPDVPIPTWDEFYADYASHFFDGSRPNHGRSYVITVDAEPVGHINYDGLDCQQSIAELDIWLRAQSFCGHGYGTDALVALMGFLRDKFAVETFIVRPSHRNQRALRAYEGAGFRPSKMSLEDQSRIYGLGDYSDTITLENKKPA